MSELLGRPIGPDENFFEAGLDSAQLLRLQDSLTTRLGLTLPATALFAYPNVRALAAFLGSDPESHWSPDHPPHARDTGRARRSTGTRGQLRSRLRGDT